MAPLLCGSLPRRPERSEPMLRSARPLHSRVRFIAPLDLGTGPKGPTASGAWLLVCLSRSSSRSREGNARDEAVQSLQPRSLSALPPHLNVFVGQQKTCCSDHQSSPHKQKGPYPLRAGYLKYCQREPCEQQTGRGKNGERSAHRGSPGIEKESPAAVPGFAYHYTFPRIVFARISREMAKRGLTTATKWHQGQINLRCPRSTAGVERCL